MRLQALAENFTIQESDGSWISHPNVDLSVFPINSLIEQKQKSGINLYCKFIQEELIPTKDNINTISSIEDVLMIGYPDGMSDSKNNLPIVRRGITATDYKIDYEGKKEFLIDASIFKGSSGSPILICNIGSFNNANAILYFRCKILSFNFSFVCFNKYTKFTSEVYNYDRNQGVFGTYKKSQAVM